MGFRAKTHTKYITNNGFNSSLFFQMLFLLMVNPMTATFAQLTPPVGEVIEEEPNASIDFSEGEPGPDGAICVTKTKYVEKLEKQAVKECWHQNVTQCHDTYVTEFLPSQEQKCEESFWKSCKIDFREMPYNYTMKQCHTPLVKMCDSNPS